MPINLPILESLTVEGYALYPGRAEKPGLTISFKPGLTLVLGANGLGKTTLVTMLFRLLTGPYDVAALTQGGNLGNSQLRSTRLSSPQRQLFANRVGDRAANASATLEVTIGSERLTIRRQLRNLDLISLQSSTGTTTQESGFQEQIVALSGVANFEDWILLLRQIIFYLDDRRALVWDPSAQRQVLRVMFLEKDLAGAWSKHETEILSLDSDMRNLSASLSGREAAVTRSESLTEAGEETQAELAALEEADRLDTLALEEVANNLVGLEDQREQARLRVLTLQDRRESNYRELEAARLRAFDSRLPANSDSLRYVFSQLMADSECLVCGNHVPEAAEELASRITDSHCILCNSDLTPPVEEIPVSLADEQLNRTAADLEAIDIELRAAEIHLTEVAGELNSLTREHQRLRSAISERQARIARLIELLPPDQAHLRDLQSGVVALRALVAEMRTTLDGKRAEFRTFVEEQNRLIQENSQQVKEAFERAAKEFLLEDCLLAWSPSSSRLGQTGEEFLFPAFDLELGGSDFTGPTKRAGPSDVSESQREFIDLAFRMALMEVAERNGVGSMVVDAPESSLDAVFSARAANVLAKFARSDRGNRLVTTSNLIEGNMIPRLLNLSTPAEDRRSRVINLVELATPTAAVRQLRREYEATLERVLSEAGAPPLPPPKA